MCEIGLIPNVVDMGTSAQDPRDHNAAAWAESPIASRTGRPEVPHPRWSPGGLTLAAFFVVSTLISGCTTSGSAAPSPTTASGVLLSPTLAPPTSAPEATTPAAATPAAPLTANPTQPAANPDDPALDRCDDLVILPCARQVGTAQLPLAGTTITLDYSSDRAAGRLQDKAPSADPIGLSGWTLSVLDSFDPATKTFIAGNGTVRHVAGSAVDGQVAIPDVTGSRVDLFDTRGRLTRTVDAVTGAVQISVTWTEHGVAAVSDAGGVTLSVIRAADGTPKRLQVPAGASTDLGFSDGRLAAVGYPDGSVAKIRTAANGLLTGWQDAAGRYLRYTYDAQGRLASSTGGTGATTTYSSSNSGSGRTVETDYPGGATAVDTVAVEGSATRWTHTDTVGAVTTLEASAAQRTITLPGGRTIDMTLAPDPRWGTDAPVLASVSDGGRRSTTAAAAPNRAAPTTPSRTLTVDGKSWTSGYDPATRTATNTDPTGAAITTSYDAKGRVVLRRSGGLPVGYHYDGDGRIDRITLGTGPDARIWTYAYRPGRTTVTDPEHDVQQRINTVLGGLLSVSGPGASGITLHRDAADRITGFAAPGAGTYQITRRADGQVAAINSPAGQGGPQFTGLTYDVDGRAATISSGGTTLSIERNAGGQVVSYDAGAGRQTARYDSRSRLTGWASTVVAVSESYTGSDVTAETTTGPVNGTVSRTLDVAGRTQSETAGGTAAVHYTYNAAGNLTRAGDLLIAGDPATGRIRTETLGSLRAVFTTNQFGETTEEKIAGPGGSAVADLLYQRDHLGRVAEFDTTTAGRTTRTVFAYDPAGRLATETTNGATTGYSYDAAGNLTSTTDPQGVVTSRTYDARNALLSKGDTTYGYDSAGRLATATAPTGTTRYHYDASGALLSVRSPGHPEIALQHRWFRSTNRHFGRWQTGRRVAVPGPAATRCRAGRERWDQSTVRLRRQRAVTRLCDRGRHRLPGSPGRHRRARARHRRAHGHDRRPDKPDRVRHRHLRAATRLAAHRIRRRRHRSELVAGAIRSTGLRHRHRPLDRPGSARRRRRFGESLRIRRERPGRPFGCERHLLRLPFDRRHLRDRLRQL